MSSISRGDGVRGGDYRVSSHWSGNLSTPDRSQYHRATSHFPMTKSNATSTRIHLLHPVRSSPCLMFAVVSVHLGLQSTLKTLPLPATPRGIGDKHWTLAWKERSFTHGVRPRVAPYKLYSVILFSLHLRPSFFLPYQQSGFGSSESQSEDRSA